MRSLRSHACQNHRKEKMKKKAWKENLAQGCDCKTEWDLGTRLGCDFRFRFSSTRPRATSIVICSKFGIWRAFRKCLGSSVTERRCLIIDSKGENWKRLVVREINLVLSGAIPECEHGRCQPNVVEIIALVTEAIGRLTLLIILQNRGNRTLLFQPLEQRCFPTFDRQLHQYFNSSCQF